MSTPTKRVHVRTGKQPRKYTQAERDRYVDLIYNRDDRTKSAAQLCREHGLPEGTAGKWRLKQLGRAKPRAPYVKTVAGPSTLPQAIKLYRASGWSVEMAANVASVSPSALARALKQDAEPRARVIEMMGDWA